MVVFVAASARGFSAYAVALTRVVFSILSMLGADAHDPATGQRSSGTHPGIGSMRYSLTASE